MVEYEAALAGPRARFAAGPSLAAMVSEDVVPAKLELFLIHFSAYGVGMTEPVEGWIRRAGERCAAIGLSELGRALRMHADHEADHHLMMIEDTRKLVARWNEQHQPAIIADQLLARSPTPGVQRYRDLHERIVAGTAPYGQIAIEYEIERTSVAHGGALIGNCVRRLGKSILQCLSFVEEHVAIDAGHTKFNAAELARLLAAHPEFLPAVIEAGSAALAAYADFLDDCVRATVPQTGHFAP